MTAILSPLPGTFYQKPSPEDPPYKAEGDAVAVDDVIGLIEVMKTFIEVKAEAAGTFAGYKVENESPVNAGDTLAELS
ncbi:biotin carboxyl carrier protein [Poseidonocella pacifica]|uniref:Biotin carboxyl carrier protein of acetyl-CoA carboxylase n=1 Tax=Poseidonocella pacifica TaxID=871651 RepID=A0A1I0UY28_9RHOB|nr:acetyl-CoA carboxylase [Poseidonocella pacifica]SFA68770.1 biotin carboxyl carrier protein [Poseidonocella pacifica]